MKLLFVNACPRGPESRTLLLAQEVIRYMQAEAPDLEWITHDLPQLHLQPVDASALAMKETCCDRREWPDDLFQSAKEFQAADAIVIAAPYWDLSFPSLLKIWVEHMYVRNLTFHYENDRCVGHAQAKACLYITTAGSPIGENDWGTQYIAAVMKALGVPVCKKLSVEALDLQSSDSDQLMAEGMKKARAMGTDLLKMLKA